MTILENSLKSSPGNEGSKIEVAITRNSSGITKVQDMATYQKEKERKNELAQSKQQDSNNRKAIFQLIIPSYLSEITYVNPHSTLT